MKFFRFVLFSFFVLLLNGCENKKTETPIREIPHCPPPPPVNFTKLTYASFTQTQKNSWDSIEKEWKLKIFYPTLSSEGFEQDCITCSDIIWLLEIKIAKDGHVISCDVSKRDIDCEKRTDEQDEKLENDVLGWFNNQIFPPNLCNMIISVHAGQITKC